LVELKNKKPFFVAFEGLDGVGKTTQLKKLTSVLSFVATKEPSNNPIGEFIKKLTYSNQEISPIAKALLLIADRKDHVDTEIKPALNDGKSVITDRFHASTVAYQCYGEGADLNLVNYISTQVLRDFEPDVYIFFDLSIGEIQNRLTQRGYKDFIESKTSDFFERVRIGYLEQIEKKPTKWEILDAGKNPNELTDDIIKVLLKRELICFNE